MQNIIQPIVDWTWREKYRYVRPDGTTDEHTMEDTHRRVVEGVYKKDFKTKDKEVAFDLMKKQIFCPAGRIHAGAGTDNQVTLINCFVSPTIQDSMRTHEGENRWGFGSQGIGDALLVALYTQQMGGGIGMDFSTLRPMGALVKRTNSISTGPLPFMDMWNAMCATVKSSGSRRGAMMAVMSISHPDIKKFITAKHTKGVLENFNVSVLVSNGFMRAVAEDKMWDLVFDVPRADGNHVDVYKDSDGVQHFVYERIRARELWDLITRSTYEYAEPGVIFMERVNEWNNLWYCETISATNPCGEQPLPPDGDCNLSAENVARMIGNPFTKDAHLQLELLKATTKVAMRFLDNVLDVSMFPTNNQAEEARMKRRTGLGITGLGNALQQLRIHYGSNDAVNATGEIMKTIRDEAYRASIELAKERGPFPMFDRNKYLDGKFIKTLPEDIRDGIAEYGIRNSVLLTIAPTGTTSLYYNNVSSGIEPTFAWKYRRKVREQDNTYTEFEEVYDYGYLLYREKFGEDAPLDPAYMVSAMELPVEAHVNIQAVCQKYVDASISKTINVPVDMPFEEFKDVYKLAYESGCKGCTTYRPSAVRGSVLSVDKEEKAKVVHPFVPSRPDQLEGTTYKVKYPGMKEAFYITLNDIIREDGSRAPFEIFINSKSVKHQEWIAALTRTLSAIFRRGGDVAFIVEELSQVHSSNGGAFVNQKYIPSLVAFIGSVIERHFRKIGIITSDEELEVVIKPSKEVSGGTSNDLVMTGNGDACPECSAPTYYRQEGCGKCTSCGYSDCG